MFSEQPRRGLMLDELGRTLLIAGIAASLVGLFFQYGSWPKIVLTAITAACLLFLVLRALSKNPQRAYQQNLRFLTAVTAVKNFFKSPAEALKNRARPAKKAGANPSWGELRKFKYFICPQCSQRLRVPRGKGRLRVTCTKCGNKFETRS